jgi:nitrogen fixation NifU-like protein
LTGVVFWDMDLYREEILDHYKNPRNFGEVESPSSKVHEANASCGDTIEISVRVTGGMIEDIKFNGEGCALSVAATSMLTERIRGKSVEFLEELNEKYMLDLIGTDVSSGRMNCVLMPLRTIEKVLSDIKKAQ